MLTNARCARWSGRRLASSTTDARIGGEDAGALSRLTVRDVPI